MGYLPNGGKLYDLRSHQLVKSHSFFLYSSPFFYSGSLENPVLIQLALLCRLHLVLVPLILLRINCWGELFRQDHNGRAGNRFGQKELFRLIFIPLRPQMGFGI